MAKSAKKKKRDSLRTSEKVQFTTDEYRYDSLYSNKKEAKEAIKEAHDKEVRYSGHNGSFYI